MTAPSGHRAPQHHPQAQPTSWYDRTGAAGGPRVDDTTGIPRVPAEDGAPHADRPVGTARARTPRTVRTWIAAVIGIVAFLLGAGLSMLVGPIGGAPGGPGGPGGSGDPGTSQQQSGTTGSTGTSGSTSTGTSSGT